MSLFVNRIPVRGARFGRPILARGPILLLLIFIVAVGAHAQAVDNNAPSAPVLRYPATGVDRVPQPTVLDVYVGDPNGRSLTVTFFGRPAQYTSPGPDFTVVAVPDTEFYTSNLSGGTPAIFQAQTQWIVQNRTSKNIAFVIQLGDSVEDGDNGGDPFEWDNAWSALSTVDLSGIPYGLAVGNHDQTPKGDPNGTTSFYNQYFGTGHFRDRYFYGGHFGSNSDNHFDLFTASGLDFIVVYIEYGPAANPTILDWANQLLQTFSDRRAIVVSHYMIDPGNPGPFGVQGQAIYNALKGNSNLFLMLCGHVSEEGRRQDTYNGNTVTTLLSDYQTRANGGNGWLRIMTFSPASNQVSVQTYSPTLNQFETDNSSQFAFAYPMQGSGANFDVISTATNVVSGSNATANWSNLAAGKGYEWYVTVSNGISTTSGPRWTFTTAADVTNNAPVADAQNVSMAEDTPLVITLHGIDPEGDLLTYAVVTAPAHGTLSGTAPNVTYTPAHDYNGSDSFTFKVNDGSHDSAPAAVTITITPVNDPPVAANDNYATDQDATLTVAAPGVLANDSDPEGSALTASIATQPGHGTLTLSANGGFTYVPNSGYSGADSFSYSANDGDGGTATATVAINVRALNQPPVANPQSVTTAANTAKAITLTGTDPDNDPLTYAVVTAPAHGTLSGAAPNVTYTPAQGYSGGDSFTFKVNDGSHDSAPAAVSITVTAANHAPVANPQSVTTDEDTPVAITLTGFDIDGDSISFVVMTQPSHGTLAGTAPNLTYTPNRNLSGSDSFTFRVSDGVLNSSRATVNITILPVNDPPVAKNYSISVTANTPYSGQVKATDVDNSILTYSVIQQPTRGTLVLDSATGAYTYTPLSVGNDVFTYQASDGMALSNIGTVAIKIR